MAKEIKKESTKKKPIRKALPKPKKKLREEAVKAENTHKIKGETKEKQSLKEFLAPKKKPPIDPFSRDEEETAPAKSTVSGRKRVLSVVAAAFVILAAIGVATILIRDSGILSSATTYAQLSVELPEDGNVVEVRAGDEYVFPIKVSYATESGSFESEIADNDRCLVGMFFSDNTKAERTAYDRITVAQDAPADTSFSVTLRFGDELSTTTFNVIAPIVVPGV